MRGVAVDRRQYDKPPVINDPEEFGMAVSAWWAAMKPGEDSEIQDAWAKTRKGGPNGLVSLLMLLLWWGRSAKNGPRAFEGDSMPLWNTTVADVLRGMESMIISLEVGAATQADTKKRKLVGTSGPTVKRSVSP